MHVVRLAPLCLAAAAVACSTAPKPQAACSSTIQQQNDLFRTTVERRFGKQPHGYNILIQVPRRQDAQGDVVLEGYKIYPVALPEPETSPEGRRLTVIMNPCTRKAVRIYEPSTRG